MEWKLEQQELGGLRFAGICRETYRVLLHTILPHRKTGLGAAIFSVLLVAYPASFRALLAVDDSAGLVRLVVLLLIEMVFFVVLLHVSLICTAGYVFCVASLYCTDGDSGATDRILRDLPRAPLKRLYTTFIHVVPLAMGMACPFVTGLVILQLNALPLPLWVLFGAWLAGAAYVAVVSHIACVVAVLEDAVSLLGLTLEGALGIVAGVAMAVALWAVVVVTLVAQPVVYMVCKNHHHEVVDKVHLNYVGEYQPLDIDGNSGIELQPVEKRPQPTATSAQPSPRPVGSTTVPS
ncbi:unnamed protein product [Alopecurus aequalis]